MGFKQTMSYLRITLFAIKVSVSIFGLISDIIYYYQEDFKIKPIKEAMAFFILLSPIIQVLAWGILLSQIQIQIPEPEQNEKVKNSKNAIEYCLNYLSCLLIYYCKMLKTTIVLLPYTVFVAILQETKLFPVFLFGYTYLKYQAVLTADLMRNISSYLELLEEKEKHKIEQEKREKSKSTSSPLLKQAQNNFQLFSQPQNQGILESENQQCNLIQLQNIDQSQIIEGNQKEGYFQKQQESIKQNIVITKVVNQSLDRNNISNQLSDNSKQTNPMNIFKTMFEQSKRNKVIQSLKMKNFIMPKLTDENCGQQNIKSQNYLKTTESNSHLNSYLLNDYQYKNQNLKSEGNQRPQLFSLSSAVIDEIKNSKQLEKQQINGKLRIPLNDINTQFENEIVKLKSEYHNSVENGDNTINSQNNDTCDQSQSKYGFSKIDVTLDANLLPTIDTLLTDKNFQQFILITDIVKAIFGALPMTIVKYINNNLNGGWKNQENNINYFIMISFLISLMTILTHGIQLMGILYNDNIKIYYKTLEYLNKMQKNNMGQPTKSEQQQPLLESNQIHLGQFAQQQQLLENLNENHNKKKNSFFGFGKLFPMIKKLKIHNQQQIKKLIMLRQEACSEVKHLSYELSNNTFIGANLLKNLKLSLPKFDNLQSLVIKFNQNYQAEGIEELIQETLLQKQSLRSIALSFYQNLLKKTQVEKISVSINEWMVNHQNQIVSVLFETELAFIWYPSQFEFEENQFLFIDKMQEILLEDINNNKILFWVNIPEKTLVDDEALILSESISRWQLLILSNSIIYQFYLCKRNDLGSFLFNCKDVSEKCKVIIKQAIFVNKSLKTYQFSSERNEMICSKGYEINLQLKNGQISIIDDNFYYSIQGAQSLISKEIKSQWKIYLHTLSLNFQKKSRASKGLSECEITSICKNIIEAKFIRNFTLNLLNNNLGDNIGCIIAQALVEQPKLESININFKGNKFTKTGFKDFINLFISKKKFLKSIELDLTGCLISQDGIKSLCQYLTMVNKQQEENNNQYKLEKFKINLTQNRLENKGLDQLLNQISEIQSLVSLDLTIKGSVLNSINFNFQRLAYLKQLNLTFWYNQFSQDGKVNFFSSLETLPNSIESLHLDVQHNGLVYENYPFLNFLMKINNIVDLSLNFEGNNLLNQLPNIQEILIDQYRLLFFTLNISGCDFDYNHILSLKQGMAFLVHLQELSLDFSKNKKFDDDCFLAIIFIFGEIKCLEKIQLFCQETSITNLSVETISYSLQTFKRLETLILDFSNNNIDENMKSLLRQSLVKAEKITKPSLII